MSRPRGFTLVEAIIALTLAVMVGALSLKLLLGQQRLARLEAARVETQLTLHAGLNYLVREFRPLAGGADLLDAGSDALTFRATRGFGLVCDLSGSSLLVADSDRYGTRLPVAGRDSLLLFRAGDSTTHSDDRWVPAAIISVASRTGCGGRPTLALSVSADSGALEPLAIRFPAPIRIYEIVQVRAYLSDGLTWLGARSVSAGESIQPVFGPLAVGGLRLSYFDPAGLLTLDRSRVRSIGITLIAQPAVGLARDSLSTRVLIRNSTAR
ncbi:MAG: type II secretion system protein [Gemmatimonadota bacterium]